VLGAVGNFGEQASLGLGQTLRRIAPGRGALIAGKARTLADFLPRSRTPYSLAEKILRKKIMAV
jgi:hypothetical protein